MITVWELDKDVKSVQLHPLQPRSFYWIDCSHPSEHDIRALAHILSVSEDLIVDSFDPKQRPQASISGKHLALAFRGATGGVGRLSIASFGIFASKQCVITIHDKQVRGIDMLLKLSGDQRLKLMNNGAGHLLYRIMDSVIDEFFHTLESIEEQIDVIENQVLREPTQIVTQKIFMLKRQLIYTHKALSVNRDIISSIEKNYIDELRMSHSTEFHELYNMIVQLLENVSTHHEILTTVLDMHVGSVNANLNKVMKTLTVLSAFVLVPGLIANIYGMNFRNMPEIVWQYGYYYSLSLMVFSIIVLYVYFKRKGWI